MGLLANGFRDTLGAYQTFGATASNNAYPSVRAANFARTGAMRNLTAGQGITDDKVGLPSGNRHPSVWMMPQKAGALAARNTLTGAGGMSDADIWAVKLALADLTGSGGITEAIAGLIVQALADLTGSGEITDANLQAFLAAVASLTGSGGIKADATGLGELIAAMSGSGAATSTLTAIGKLIAALTVTGTGLSTANVGQAVWEALASANNAAGTMGEKLNDAGSASNPWTEVLESGFTAAQILRLIAAAVQGDATGLESGAPVFKGLDGTTERITATYVDGVRTVTDRDAD